MEKEVTNNINNNNTSTGSSSTGSSSTASTASTASTGSLTATSTGNQGGDQGTTNSLAQHVMVHRSARAMGPKRKAPPPPGEASSTGAMRPSGPRSRDNLEQHEDLVAKYATFRDTTKKRSPQPVTEQLDEFEEHWLSPRGSAESKPTPTHLTHKHSNLTRTTRNVDEIIRGDKKPSPKRERKDTPAHHQHVNFPHPPSSRDRSPTEATLNLATSSGERDLFLYKMYNHSLSSSATTLLHNQHTLTADSPADTKRRLRIHLPKSPDKEEPVVVSVTPTTIKKSSRIVQKVRELTGTTSPKQTQSLVPLEPTEDELTWETFTALLANNSSTSPGSASTSPGNPSSPRIHPTNPKEEENKVFIIVSETKSSEVKPEKLENNKPYAEDNKGIREATNLDFISIKDSVGDINNNTVSASSSATTGPINTPVNRKIRRRTTAEDIRAGKETLILEEIKSVSQSLAEEMSGLEKIGSDLLTKLVKDEKLLEKVKAWEEVYNRFTSREHLKQEAVLHLVLEICQRLDS